MFTPSPRSNYNWSHPAEGVQGTAGSRSMRLCSFREAESSLGNECLYCSISISYFPKQWSSVTRTCLFWYGRRILRALKSWWVLIFLNRIQLCWEIHPTSPRVAGILILVNLLSSQGIAIVWEANLNPLFLLFNVLYLGHNFFVCINKNLDARDKQKEKNKKFLIIPPLQITSVYSLCVFILFFCCVLFLWPYLFIFKEKYCHA